MKQTTDTAARYAAVFTSLFRTYAILLFGVNRWQNIIRKKNTSGSRIGQLYAEKTGGNTGNTELSIVKTAFFFLFLIYIGGCFVMLFRILTVNLYRSLQPLGMQQFLFEIEITAFFVFLFISNFLLTLTTYFIGSIEQTLRSMPIPSHIFFGAKLLAHCVPAIIISLGFFAVIASVYGHYEQSSTSFYVMALIGAVFFPLPIIGLCYLINIIVMRTTTILRNQRFVILITGVLSIVTALGINFVVQSVNMLNDIPNVENTLVQYRQRISVLIRSLLPVRFFASSLTADSFSAALGSFLAFIAVCVAFPAAVVGLLSGVYEKTLDGFDAQTLKRLTVSETVQLIRSRITRRGTFTALLLREIRIMNREPAYLLNGPFTIVLLPLLYGIMSITGSIRLGPEMEVFMQSGTGILIAGGCGAFFGSATGIAATAVSRDAKNLAFIKSLPLSIRRYMQAKLAHAMLFACIGAPIGAGGAAILFSLTPLTTTAASIIALSLSLFCNLLALILDTAHPQLQWDTPAALIKHNLNKTIMLFSTLLLLSTAIAAAMLIAMPQHLYLFYFAGLPLLASTVIAHFFWPYAERKIAAIEI